MKASERFLQNKKLNRWERFSLLSEVTVWHEPPVYNWQDLKQARATLAKVKRDIPRYLQQTIRCGFHPDQEWYDEVKDYVLTTGWCGRGKLL